jgi:hypothetical protein
MLTIQPRSADQQPGCPRRSGRPGRLATVIGTAYTWLVTYALYADQPTPVPLCALRLAVEVTPDVPNPANGGFLSSLLGDNVGYQLFLIGSADDTHVTLQLQGPGPPERCQAVVDSMRNDGRVVTIDVT